MQPQRLRRSIQYSLTDMAKSLDLQLLPRVLVTGAYAMIGATRINHFDQVAEIDVYIFESEDARRQRLAPSEHELHRPVKTITVRTTFDTYKQYIEEAAQNLAAAGYRLITEVPASASAEPRGLKEFLENAADI